MLRRPTLWLLASACLWSPAHGAGPVVGRDAARKRVDALVDAWLKPPGADRRAAEVALDTSVPAIDPSYLDAACERQDLPDDARAWLRAYVERERGREPARAVNRRRVDLWNEWNGGAIDQFEKFGHHDPKWDDAAREGVRVYTNAPTDPPKAYELLGKAVALGCDDPLVVYFCGRSMLPYAKPEAADERLRASAKAMASTDYPVYRKAMAAFNAYEHYYTMTLAQYREEHRPIPEDFGPTLDALYAAYMKLWPLMAADPACAAPGVAEQGLEEIATCRVEMECWPQKDRKTLFDAIYPPLEKALPKSPIPLIVKGKFYVKYAWDARGNGMGNTVTAEGWRLFNARLIEAQRALEAAWALDPTRAEIADTMMTVALGLNWPRDQLELWFNRAMKADPDDVDACRSKLYYLEPKWHGSAKEMLDFGHECLAGGNWRGEIPWLLVDAHFDLAAYGDADAYWGQPDVWDDVQSVYVPFLKAQAANAYVRSRYCYFACRCGRWEVAVREFQSLGDHALPERFGGVEAMRAFREKASEKSGVPLEPLK